MEDLEAFRYSGAEVAGRKVRRGTGRKPRNRGAPFIRGPIPVAWLIAAATLPRRNALVIGLVLHYLAGLQSSHRGLVLCVERCKPYGLGRKAVARGLADLEGAGLIRVARSSGRCPRIDILGVAGGAMDGVSGAGYDESHQD
jgi:hypothetical protein